MTWRADAPEGNEAAKCIYDVVQFCRGTGLDIGCGPKKALPSMIGVDSKKDTALFGIAMQPDNVVDDASRLPMVPDGRVDYVFSSHLLEHLEDYQAALKEWWRIIRVGGYLVLYLPHKDLYPNIGQPGSNPDHKHDFVPADILAAMHDMDWTLHVNEVRDARDEYSFLMVFEKLEPHADGATRCHIDLTTAPRPDKTVCLSRFGGFGDMLQMANILPELKRQGYHVTVNTTPKGQNVLRHDPHIDAWLLVDDDLIPNHELPLFWEACARRYTKFIQLSESIEGTLLAMPGRANHAWPHAVRAVELNKNYLEWISTLAELPYYAEAKFYPSEAEQDQAQDCLIDARSDYARRTLGRALYIGEELPRVFSIMWVLSGSSMHKFYPHMDAVIARVLMECPEAVLFFNGDEPCKLLEQGWELEPRVYCNSGKVAIRDSLTLAQLVDCVVGPETGILNAVGFQTNAKVLFLSHSSVENLSRDWINTTSLQAPFDWNNPVCHNQACHRLHYGSKFCVEDAATGAAACQVAIHPGAVFDAIYAAYQRWKAA